MNFEEQDLPAICQAANEASGEAQTHFLWITAAELLLILTAAGAGVIGTGWSSVVAAISFVVAIVLRVQLLSKRPERTWYDGRAVAESAKNLAWRYAVGADPFRIDGVTEDDAEETFVQRLTELLHGMKGLQLPPPSGRSEQISLTMRDLRNKPLADRKEVYRKDRIEDQQDWYARRSQRNKRWARFWSGVLLLIEVAGATAAILTAAGWLEVDLLGLAGALVAAGVSWLQTKQHNNLAESYSVAAQELAAIKAQIGSKTTEGDWARFVNDAEEAISREHTLWKASRTN